MYKLIIADDEEDIRNGLASIVQWHELGFHVVEVFEDGRDVIGYLKDHDVDVILTDIMMTHQSGLDIAKWVYENQKNIQVVILSGYSEFEFAQKAINYGVKQYLLKPTNFTELQNTFKRIKTLLDETKTRSSHFAEFHHQYQRLLLSLMLMGMVSGEFVEEIFTQLGILESYKSYYWGVVVVKNRNSPESHTLKNCMDPIKHIFDKWNGWQIVTTLYNDNLVVLVFAPAKSTLDAFKKNIEEQIIITLSRLNRLFNYKLYIYLSMVYHDYKALFSNVKLQKFIDAEKKSINYGNFANEQKYHNLLQESLNALDQFNIDYLKNSIEILSSSLEEDSSDCMRRLAFSLAMKLRSYYQKHNFIPNEINDENVYYKVFAEKDISKVKEYTLSILGAYEKNIRENTSDILQTVCNYISENIHNKITLSDIADQVYLNPAYLSRLFKEKMGVNFNEYVIKMRMDKAQELLINSKMRVYEIAEKVGYRDITHFYKIFRRVVGITPSDYRKNLYRNND